MALFPRIPESRSTTDFVVIVFVVLVATIMLLMAVGIMVGALNGADITPFFNVMTDILTTIIGSLIGFIAGKGSGRQEVSDELRRLDEASRSEEP